MRKATDVIASIGVFDGVHLGHQKILNKLTSLAKKHCLKSMVITFHPHPQKVLNPHKGTPLLMSLQHRMKIIKEMGVDFCFVVKFTKKFAGLEAEEFVKKLRFYSRHSFKLRGIVIGENFLFGRNSKGDKRILKNLGREYGFSLNVVQPLKIKNKIISSTRIRRLIEKGELSESRKLLGRPVTVLGTVVKGRRIGRELGFPTANINPHHESIPPSGVYKVAVKVNNNMHKGILNIGTRPTFTKDKEPTIELHIFDFKKDIYGKDVEIIFKRKIREEKKFSSIEEFKKQIASDITLAKK